MELSELVQMILRGDLLAARQWVSDAQRARLDWARLAEPAGLTARELTVAAGVAELLASRAGVTAPSWTLAVGAQKEAIVLDPGLEQMPRSLEHAQSCGPEGFRKRNLIALPDFLHVA